ncbi:hypothetical protein DL95DRAFT_387377 [Leptodontidium sp. 2 PMI_412]|nr:hypothetical protein DL95DRAFT_387377 [Leptodontidium sp. 2 PMI_412]
MPSRWRDGRLEFTSDKPTWLALCEACRYRRESSCVSSNFTFGFAILTLRETTWNIKIKVVWSLCSSWMYFSNLDFQLKVSRNRCLVVSLAVLEICNPDGSLFSLISE